jgi:hypothetical protein
LCTIYQGKFRKFYVLVIQFFAFGIFNPEHRYCLERCQDPCFLIGVFILIKNSVAG